MKTKFIVSIVLLAFVMPFTEAFGQDSELYIPGNIQKAYDNQTRSMAGSPGEHYWQNRANYSMNIEFDPTSRLLKGEAEITYFNNSPDTLTEMYIHLLPNFFKKGQLRDLEVAYSDESDGVKLEYISINNAAFDTAEDNEKLEYGATNLKVTLDSPIAPHSQVPVKVKWNYVVNQGSHNRTGGVDPTSYFIAYFFPHIAVYDDIDGWDDFHYKGDAEFYNEFGDFDVNITVPGDFVVWATGLLQNSDEVLQEKYLKRYQAAQTADHIVHVVDSTEALQRDVTTKNPKNVWRYKAENVSDFAFGTSNHYLWDATSLVVDKTSGRRVLIDAAYNKNSPDFYSVNEIARNAIDYMSTVFPAVPFPFPQMTVFNGLDEMEYPMMVNNFTVYNEELKDYPNKENYAVALTAHEIFHSYFPFYMGINESKYAWMDEGWATFGDYAIATELLSNPAESRWGEDSYMVWDDVYREIIGTDEDLPILNDSKMIRRPAYSANSYVKPAVVYMILRDVLGEELFKNTMHEYMKRWNGKHPTAYDFFFTMNQVSGQDLNWLFHPWFFTYGYPDLAITNVSQNSGEYVIEIDKIGNYPMSIHLTLTYEDGSVEIIQKNASVWKNGESNYSVSGSTSKNIKKVELGNVIVPDADLSNNIYLIK